MIAVCFYNKMHSEILPHQNSLRFQLKSEFEREVLRQLWEWEDEQAEPEIEDSEREAMRKIIEDKLRSRDSNGGEL